MRPAWSKALKATYSSSIAPDCSSQALNQASRMKQLVTGRTTMSCNDALTGSLLRARKLLHCRLRIHVGNNNSYEKCLLVPFSNTCPSRAICFLVVQ